MYIYIHDDVALWDKISKETEQYIYDRKIVPLKITDLESNKWVTIFISKTFSLSFQKV